MSNPGGMNAFFTRRAMFVIDRSYWPGTGDPELRELTLGGMLAETAATAPWAIALVEGSPEAGVRRRWSYTELLADSERLASVLLEHFRPGERIAVWAHNIPEWEILQFASAIAGLVLVTVNPAYGRAELTYVLAQSRSSGVVVATSFRGRDLMAEVGAVRADLPELRFARDLAQLYGECRDRTPDRSGFPEVAPGDAAIIQYTSGTTGFPKGAVLSHRGLVNNGYLLADRMGAHENCVWVNPMPMFHVGGCEVAALGAMAMAGTHVLMSWDPTVALDLVESERGTVLGAVPTMLLAMREHPEFATREISSLTSILSGGTPVAPEIVRMVESDFRSEFVMIFGQTETSGVICESHPSDSVEDKSGTVGRPLPHTEVKIADPETGEPTALGSVGEIVVRGFGNMIEYFDRPEETAATLEPDGWLHTGDLGTMDHRGFIRVTGRLKDMVIRGGENLFPREVEDVLIQHAGVADVAVVGVPDDYYGEELCAFVRAAADPAPSPEELSEYLHTQLARHKVPKHWRFVDALPVTPSGKIQKFVLRGWFEKECVAGLGA